MPEPQMIFLSTYPGVLHPLLVHLPIGILVLAIVFDLGTSGQRHDQRRTILKWLYSIGALSAILSATSGWKLAEAGDYSGDLVDKHRWSGMITAFLSLLAWWIQGTSPVTTIQRGVSSMIKIGLLIGLLLTGHWGGSMTHGEGFLFHDDPARNALSADDKADTQAGSGSAYMNLTEPAEAPDNQRIRTLEATGALLLPLAKGSRNLELNLVNCRTSPDSVLHMAEPLAPFIIRVDLGGKPCTDAGLASVARLTRTRSLNLSGTAITDEGMRALASLKDLESLNLTSSRISSGGMAYLDSLASLRKVYVYGTAIRPGEIKRLQQKFKNVDWDTGGYRLPLLATDTTIVREKKKP